MNSQWKIPFVLLEKSLISNLIFIGSLNVDSLFTNINLEETIEICTNEPFKESETVEGFSKSESKELLSFATKDSHFIFNGIF